MKIVLNENVIPVFHRVLKSLRELSTEVDITFRRSEDRRPLVEFKTLSDCKATMVYFCMKGDRAIPNFHNDYKRVRTTTFNTDELYKALSKKAPDRIIIMEEKRCPHIHVEHVDHEYTVILPYIVPAGDTIKKPNLTYDTEIGINAIDLKRAIGHAMRLGVEYINFSFSGDKLKLDSSDKHYDYPHIIVELETVKVKLPIEEVTTNYSVKHINLFSKAWSKDAFLLFRFATDKPCSIEVYERDWHLEQILAPRVVRKWSDEDVNE